MDFGDATDLLHGLGLVFDAQRRHDSGLSHRIVVRT
jgi:hypothetical protein